jgi:hypothetical protein
MMLKGGFMGRTLIFIAGVAAGAAASALAADGASFLNVSVQVVPVATVSLVARPDGPVLTVGGQRVLLEGDGSAIATVEY